jgi:hypothetical protein
MIVIVYLKEISNIELQHIDATNPQQYTYCCHITFCECNMTTQHDSIRLPRPPTLVTITHPEQVLSVAKYDHCCKHLGVFPDYNPMWDLYKFDVYQQTTPDPMHVLDGDTRCARVVYAYTQEWVGARTLAKLVRLMLARIYAPLR